MSATGSVTIYLDGTRVESLDREWDVSLRDDRGARFAAVRIRNLLSETFKDDLAWYCQRYAFEEPFAGQKALDIDRRLEFQFSIIAALLRPELAKHAATTLHIQSPETVFIVVTHSSEWPIFQAIPWEILERKRYWTSWLGEEPHVAVSRERSSLIQSSLFADFDTGNATNVLFVSARLQDGEDRADYRLISKPLLQIFRRTAGRVVPDFVRPGTWTAFKAKLKNTAFGFYRWVHLDVHGVVKGNGGLAAPQVFFAPEHDSRESSEAVSFQDLLKVLRDAGVSIIVLNACSSAKTLENEMSNLASSLVRSGISAVLAMSYDVMSDAAGIFMKAFYNSVLIESMNLEQAAYMGRSALRDNQQRNARYGLTVNLKDDFVPVLYQRQVEQLPQAHRIRLNIDLSLLPLAPLVESDTDTDFFGRDKDIMNVETMLLRHKVVVVSGSGGEGKTAFARHSAKWWMESGFVDRYITFDAQDAVEPDFNNLMAIESAKDYTLVIIDDVMVAPPGLQNGAWIEFEEARRQLCRFAEEVAAGKTRVYLLILTQLEEKSFSSILPGSWNLQRLERLQFEDFYSLAKIVDPDQTQTLLRGGNQQLEDTIERHDWNMIAISATFNLIVSLPEASKEQCWHVPSTISREAIDIALESADRCQSHIIRSYWKIRDFQKQKSPIAWLVLISLVPFRRWVPYSELFLSDYVVKLQRAQILLDKVSQAGNDQAKVISIARDVGRDSADLLKEENLSALRHEFRILFELLRSYGLVLDRENRPSTDYIGVHPLLPYLLGIDVFDCSSGLSLWTSVDGAFAQFYENHLCHFDDSDVIIGVPRFGLETVVKEDWANICRALFIRMDVQVASQSGGPSALLNTLCLLRMRFDYLTPLERTNRIDSCTLVLEKMERYASSTDASTLPNTYLDEALAIGYVRAWIHLSQGDFVAQSTRRNAFTCSALVAACTTDPSSMSSASRFFFLIVNTVKALFDAPAEGQLALQSFLASPCPTDINYLLQFFHRFFKLMVYMRFIGPARQSYGEESFPLKEMVGGANKALAELSQDPDILGSDVEQQIKIMKAFLLQVYPGADTDSFAAAFLQFFPSKTDSGIDGSSYQLITLEATSSPSKQKMIALQALEDAVDSSSFEQQINCCRYLRNLAFKSGEFDTARLHTAHMKLIESSPLADFTSVDSPGALNSNFRELLLLDILCDPKQEPDIRSDNLLIPHKMRISVAAETSRDNFPANHARFMSCLAAYEIALIRGICQNFQYLLESPSPNAEGQLEVSPEVAYGLMLPILRVWQEGFPQSFLEHCVCQALRWNPSELHHFLSELADGLRRSQYSWCRLRDRLVELGGKTEEARRQLGEEGKLPDDLRGKPFRILRPLVSPLRLKPTAAVQPDEMIKWIILKVRFEYSIMSQCITQAGMILFHESRRLDEDPYWARDSLGEWSLREFYGQVFLRGRIRFRRTPLQAIAALWWRPVRDSLEDLEVCARRVPLIERIAKPPRSDLIELFNYVPRSDGIEDSVD